MKLRRAAKLTELFLQQSFLCYRVQHYTHIDTASSAQGIQVFVVVGGAVFEIAVLFVEHLLRGCQLDRQGAHLADHVVVVAQLACHGLPL